MALRYYDEAVKNKIANWVKDPNMLITSPNETRRLFEYTLDRNNDKPISLPLIALRRNPDVRILNPNKRALTFDGATTEANELKVSILNAIPIALTYQLDIYTRYYEECDDYVRNFIFNFINYPNLHITIPYNGSEIDHDSTITLLEDFSDNSDIPERLIPGQFTRFTLNFTVDDAYLFSIPVRDTVKLETEACIETGKEKEIIKLEADVEAKLVNEVSIENKE